MSGSLEQRMADLLAEASVLSEASAAGPSERTSSSKTGSKAPTTSGISSYDQIRRSFARCRSRQDRLDAIVAAEGLISAHKRRSAHAPTPEEYRYWLIQKYEGVSYAVVAIEEGISPSYVRKIRSEWKPDARDPNRGLPLEKAA